MFTIISAVLVSLNTSPLAFAVVWAILIATVIAGYFVYKFGKKYGFDTKYTIAKQIIKWYAIFFKFTRNYRGTKAASILLTVLSVTEFVLGWYEYFYERSQNKQDSQTTVA